MANTAAIGGRSVWPYYSSSNAPNSGSAPTNELGKDQFLRILITQLQNQDPMQPLQDRDFIAQMAQFSSVEQLVKLVSEMQLLRQSLGTASGLIGKEVTWNVYDSFGRLEGTESGVVEAVLIRDGKQFAKVGSVEVPFDEIVMVREAGGIGMNDPNALRLYTQPLQPAAYKANLTKPAVRTPPSQGATFQQLLEKSMLTFSQHAERRLAERGITLGAEHLRQLNGAVDKAAAKGAKESLVLLKDLAFIVNVKNRTVVTAMDQESMNDHVFTNIDSTIVVR